MIERPSNIDDADHDDEVDEASMDSFPASDPPGWWAGHDRSRERREDPDEASSGVEP